MTISKTIIITAIFKQILNYSLLPVFVLFISCNTQNKTKNDSSTLTDKTTVPNEATNIDSLRTSTSAEIGKSIISILQDKNNNYWFGTDGEGVYRYDGKSLIQFTEKDGLPDNQIQSIQEDKSGNIWFGTGGFGVSRFDGQTFTTFANKESPQSGNSSEKNLKIEPDDLWFHAGGGVYLYNSNSFNYLPLPKTDLDNKYSQSPSNRLGPYGVYCILKDKKGNLWFGTQTMGVCRYDARLPASAGSDGNNTVGQGKSFTWLNEKGLNGPAVLALFEDKNGTLWFGNNGNGLFRYDPSADELTNFTKEKGLSNDEFLKNGKPGPGTLARIYSINEDNNGNLWVGTIDAGVWRYDGKNLTNYTTKDGLTGNSVVTIYKDKKGELLFGTEEGVCKFNGTSFTRFAFK